MTDTPTVPDDGRNPEWSEVIMAVWESVMNEVPLTGPDVARLRLALDDLHDADELLTLAQSIDSARDVISAYAGARAARKAARELIRELTAPPKPPSKPGRPPKAGPIHGHRTQRERRQRAAAATWLTPDDDDDDEVPW